MKNQVLTASGWLKFEWCDEFLQWSPRDYGGIDELILFQKDVWLPDIFVENTAQHYRELGNNQMLISVKSTGMVHWEPGIITETSCAVNIGKYPFDTQVCDIRFLTWMHTNKTLTVGPEIDKINMDALLPNGEWDITRTEAKEYRYPSTYRMGTDHTGVTFVVHLRRKRFFYVLNTIIPVVMLSCLNVLVFILPSDCGERMALAVTVLLAFTVYLGIISDNIPKTSESLSLLAIYLTSLLALSTASVVCAGIVLNIHYRDPSHPVPRMLKLIFSGIGSCALGFKDTRPSISSADSRRCDQTNCYYFNCCCKTLPR
ncbi:neuronal acetylcholine receptor subunit alpha-7 [Plakobranchus ocellatus]|uniref:Neuronal acetylcholine receptor subunit alpha-7 n=1 Tax=Plakobranchus ocellatus TaxID=259542 RepID=A0AAV3YZ54_9GAST|nr:neuronal acetylcholine receptor subunit alpha-7 [Plakobranchus ocellatus]